MWNKATYPRESTKNPLGNVWQVHFWLIECVTYQAIPAKLLSALIIHCRLFTPVLHVFCDLWIIYTAVIKNTILMETLDGSSSAVTRTFTHVSIHHPSSVRSWMRTRTKSKNNKQSGPLFFFVAALNHRWLKAITAKLKLNVSNQVLITGVSRMHRRL